MNRNPDVERRILVLLRAAPDMPAKTLYVQATKVDPAIAELSLPQFQGRYYLPALREVRMGLPKSGENMRSGSTRKGSPQLRKRSLKTGRTESRVPLEVPTVGATSPSTPDATPGLPPKASEEHNRTTSMDVPPRNTVREVLMELATQMGEAQTNTDVIRVFQRIDEYQSRIVEAFDRQSPRPRRLR